MSKNVLTREQMADRNIFRIHPSFRIVALAAPPTRENSWCTSEILSMFPFIDTIEPLSLENKLRIITTKHPIQKYVRQSSHGIQEKILSILSLTYNELDRMEHSSHDVKVSASSNQISFVPSCRQFLRLWNGCCEAYTSTANQKDAENFLLDYITERFRKMFLVEFMPQTLKDTFDASLCRVKLTNNLSNFNVQTDKKVPIIEHTLDSVKIGNSSLPKSIPSRPELVPNTYFINIPTHIKYLESIAHDILAGERHILLIGNQGLHFILPLRTPRNWKE